MGKYDDLLSAAPSAPVEASKYADLLAAVTPQEQSAQTAQNSILNPADDSTLSRAAQWIKSNLVPSGIRTGEDYRQVLAGPGPDLSEVASQPIVTFPQELPSHWGPLPIPEETRKYLETAFYRPAAGFVSAATEPRNIGLAALSAVPGGQIPAAVGFGAEIAAGIPDWLKQYQQVEQTPPGSAERVGFGLGTVGTIAGLGALGRSVLGRPLTAADAIRARTEAPSASVEPSAPKTGEPAPPLEPVPEAPFGFSTAETYARFQPPETTHDITQFILRRRGFLMNEAQQLGQEVEIAKAQGLRPHPAVEDRLAQINDELNQPTIPTTEEPTNAIREQETGTLLQRQPEETGTPGSQRGRMEPSQQGLETAGEVAGREDIQATTEPETTGIAQRISERQAVEGKIGPIQPGQGASWQEMVARGDELIRDEGVDPDRVAAEFSRDGTINGDRMAVLRARDTDLAHEATITEEALRQNPNDPNLQAAYKEAFDRWTDWRQNKVKPAQTVWHLAGEAMQGEEPIDVTSYTGIRRAVVEQKGRDLSLVESREAIRFSDQVKQAAAEENGVLTQFDQVVRKSLGNKMAMTLDELRDRIAKETEVLCP